MNAGARQCWKRRLTILIPSKRILSITERRFSELVNDIDGGRVELLVILGGNPAYNTPADLKLDLNRLSKVKLRVHLKFAQG